MPVPPNTPDRGAEVSKAAQGAIQALAMLFDAVNQTAPDSPIAGAVQDLLKATSEVKRHILAVGPDLQQGTSDDGTPPPDEAPPGGPMDEGDFAADIGAEEAPGGVPGPGDDGAPIDPGPMGPGPFNAAGRGMNAALLNAAKRRQP
jgi:hypothetical protein